MQSCVPGWADSTLTIAMPVHRKHPGHSHKAYRPEQGRLVSLSRNDTPSAVNCRRPTLLRQRHTQFVHCVSGRGSHLRKDQEVCSSRVSHPFNGHVHFDICWAIFSTKQHIQVTDATPSFRACCADLTRPRTSVSLDLSAPSSSFLWQNFSLLALPWSGEQRCSH